jgi:internalin A
VVLNEAKLILIGEGEVGKSCLLGALRGDPWEEGRLTTHGIEIKPVKVTNSQTDAEITLNGWDFGGQPVYRPIHQLFFSAPAVTARTAAINNGVRFDLSGRSVYR